MQIMAHVEMFTNSKKHYIAMATGTRDNVRPNKEEGGYLNEHFARIKVEGAQIDGFAIHMELSIERDHIDAWMLALQAEKDRLDKVNNG